MVIFAAAASAFTAFAMLATAVIFGGIAAADGRWALAGAMFGIGLIAVGLMVVHYWLLYRFGKGPTE